MNGIASSSICAELLRSARRSLLDRRVAAGYWQGHLSSSALATATAATALAVARAAGVFDEQDQRRIRAGLDWLVTNRNADEGWGDTPHSVSNISTTALVWAALAFGDSAAVQCAAASAERWIARAAGSSEPHTLAAALAERYGKDGTFSVPILTMCAVAGRLGHDAEAWQLIPQLPFELAVLPQRFYGALRLPVVSYALPALISMGLARHRRGATRPVLTAIRECASARVLNVLERLQPEGGGFLEAIPLTSFVAMSLVAAGEPCHPVVQQALQFLRRSMRADGSWPIDSNLATWVTTLSLNALAAGGALTTTPASERRALVDWLLAQQWRGRHRYTGAAPGGWAWTDLPGGVPDADDTAGALVALAHLGFDEPDVRAAAAMGVRWLLDLQNGDGGIPTFCRGWGALPFDRSATDLTAHGLRAWAAWREVLEPALRARVDRATARALAYLARNQRADGAFVPLWFGNQAEAREENPVLGTSRVLSGVATVALDSTATHMRTRAVQWLLRAQNPDGGWGGGPGVSSSIEETALAVTGLADGAPEPNPEIETAVREGLTWLHHATDQGTRFTASPVGLYFARLWYAEDLYPNIFTVSATEAVARQHNCTGPEIQKPTAGSGIYVRRYFRS